MSYKTAGTDVLMEKRSALLAEKSAMEETFNKQIQEIETCIELLEGKKVWEIVQNERYEDENPDYIRSSVENQPFLAQNNPLQANTPQEENKWQQTGKECVKEGNLRKLTTYEEMLKKKRGF